MSTARPPEGANSLPEGQGRGPKGAPVSVERDPWLEQSLRHAPDREVAVPPQVREAILQAARQAVRVPATPPVAPTPNWWQRLKAPWTTPMRLGYSGAFMALMVAGLWGVDHLSEEAAHPSPGAAAPAAPDSAAATPTPHVPVASELAPVPATANSSTAQVADASAVSRPLIRARAPARPAAAVLRDEARVAASPPPPSVVRPPEPASPALAEVTAGNVAAASAVPTGRLMAAAPAAPMPAAAPKPTAAPMGAVADIATPTPPDPLLPALQALRADGAARWQAGAAQGPHTAVQTAWLERLRSATAGQWHQAATAPAASTSVQWTNGQGAPLLSVTLAQGAWLRWQGVTYSAALSSSAAAELERLRGDWP